MTLKSYWKLKKVLAKFKEIWYNVCGFEGTYLKIKYRGLVKWYDRGLQNLWWEFDSLIPCTLGAWKSIKGFQALLFCPKKARHNMQSGVFWYSGLRQDDYGTEQAKHYAQTPQKTVEVPVVYCYPFSCFSKADYWLYLY